MLAFTRWVNVTSTERDTLLNGGWLPHRDDRYVHDFGKSSMLVVPRTLWEAVNGFDERFVGWGYEDRAFYRACELMAGTPLRIHGDVYHLEHERGEQDTRRRYSIQYALNRAHCRNYEHTPNRESLLALVANNQPVTAPEYPVV